MSYWERGETVPSTMLLPALAGLVGCSIDELFTTRRRSARRPVGAP